MGFIHGLAVFLIIFEGIINKCKGTAPVDTTSLNWIQDAPIIEINEDQPFLPNHLIEVIISHTDFKTAQKTVRSGIINATNIVMSRILQNRIIVITSLNFDWNDRELYEDGDIFLRFGNYRGLASLFDRFGDQVKKIEIYYFATSAQVYRTIINRCVNNLEELRIRGDDRRIWDVISNGDNGIIFPEVKKFQFFGNTSRIQPLNLNLIFPKLESIKLNGYLGDIKCLANITRLKELKLNTDSIEEHQLDHIFANNKNLTMISLKWPRRADTMHAIAKYLTKLETLEVNYPAGNFLFRSNDWGSYELSSMTYFRIKFFGIDELIGDLSFDMPHLKKLRLDGALMDNNRIIDFSNHFKELETVELLAINGLDPVECIEQLKHIKECMANNFEKSGLHSLRKMFEHFDVESKLQTLKLVGFNDSYQRYKDTMQKININLAKSNKPTWTLTQGEQNGTGRKYLMFKREPLGTHTQFQNETATFTSMCAIA